MWKRRTNVAVVASTAGLIADHLSRGDAQREAGQIDKAIESYNAALGIDDTSVHAHIALATMRLPGDFYHRWIERFYSELAPESIIEIGIFEGQTLALAKPPTLVAGVDPNPKILFPLKTETRIFPETSDAFFAKERPRGLLQGRTLSVGFIDGLHLFEQALKDFINLERYCGPRSIILFHDTMPLNERTQRRACDTQFHTGDVWKIVPILRKYRPELDVFTIAAPWTGLTVVTGMQPQSSFLAEGYQNIIAEFMPQPFAAIEGDVQAALNVVPNDWDAVRLRLERSGVT